MLINDFADAKNPQYAIVNAFFTNNLTNDLMKKVSTSKNLMQRLRQFFEFNLDYICEEHNLFNLCIPNALEVCFSKFNL